MGKISKFISKYRRYYHLHLQEDDEHAHGVVLIVHHHTVRPQRHQQIVVRALEQTSVFHQLLQHNVINMVLLLNVVSILHQYFINSYSIWYQYVVINVVALCPPAYEAYEAYETYEAYEAFEAYYEACPPVPLQNECLAKENDSLLFPAAPSPPLHTS